MHLFKLGSGHLRPATLMSLAASPDCLSRPEDKALTMLFPVEHEAIGNSFDEFLNRDVYDHGDREEENTAFLNTHDFLNAGLHSTANKTASLAINAHKTTRNSPQPWRKGLWCLNPGRTAQLLVNKTRNNNDTEPNASPSHLHSNENFVLRNFRSEVSRDTKKKQSSTPLLLNNCFGQYQRKPDSPELQSSPTLANSQLDNNGNMSFYDSWQQDFQDFKLDLEDNISHFSKASYKQGGLETSTIKTMNQAAVTRHAKLQGVRNTRGALSSTSFARNATTSFPAPTNDIAEQQVALPFDDTFSYSSNSVQAGRGIHSQDEEQDIFWYPDWTVQSLHSSNSSDPSQPAGGPQFRISDTQSWHSDWIPSQANSVPSHLTHRAHDSFIGILQPTPQRATHKVIQHHNSHHDLHPHYALPDEIGVAIPYQRSEEHRRTVSCHPVSYSQTPTFTNALVSYPPLPPPVPGSPHGSPFSTPGRKRNKSTSRSPSPPVSPTNMRSRSLKQKSPTRSEQGQHRRKSIHKIGPMKDCGNESQRNRSASRPPRTPKTPKTPTGGFGAVDFVNYTPKDAAKLLTDVAPSGSSRTRARREQEAKDKRKRISEAALQAVRNAGGDVTALEQAMLQHVQADEDEF